MSMKKSEHLKLNSVKFGISGGILYSLFVLLISIFSNVFPSWENLIFECYGFFGYNVTSFLGFLLGIIYSFIDGFLVLFFLSWIYNRLN